MLIALQGAVSQGVLWGIMVPRSACSTSPI